MPQMCLYRPLTVSFIGKEKVSEIMGIYPPEQKFNSLIMNQLMGKNSVKPFECVLTRAEAQAAFDTVELSEKNQFNKLLSSWTDNPNMSENFEKILKDAL